MCVGVLARDMFVGVIIFTPLESQVREKLYFGYKVRRVLECCEEYCPSVFANISQTNRYPSAQQILVAYLPGLLKELNPILERLDPVRKCSSAKRENGNQITLKCSSAKRQITLT